MRIGFTYDCKTDWQRLPGDPEDINAEFDKPEAIEFIERGLRESGHEVVRIGNVEKLLAGINDLDVDIVFNICEGRQGRNRESQVPLLLEMKGIPFVGADALTLGVTLDKRIAKKCFTADGILTPKFFSVTNVEELETISDLPFPLIVKNTWEGTSKGLTKKSLVRDRAALTEQVAYITGTYGQPALVEQFISGTEHTVAVVGNNPPEAMPVVQVKIRDLTELGDLFYTHAMVIDDDIVRYQCPAQLPAELSKRMQELAVRAYRSVGCRDFGRVDFRVDSQGQPFVLEINPLPSLASSDIFNVFPQTMGTTYSKILQRIISAAVERNGLTEQPAWKLEGVS